MAPPTHPSKDKYNILLYLVYSESLLYVLLILGYPLDLVESGLERCFCGSAYILRKKKKKKTPTTTMLSHLGEKLTEIEKGLYSYIERRNQYNN